MRERGVSPPKWAELEKWLNAPVVLRWLNDLWTNYPRVRSYEVAFDPGSVGANTTAEHTVTVNGLTVADVVIVNKPTLTAGVAVAGARVSAADTLAVTFVNPTGGSLDPGSETYRVVAIRL